jgi:2-C-methyl-D-erythritol 2,4-cyclodiphosphate synthase
MVRFGIGYDVHRLVEGRPLVLGGVEITHTHGLEGHSDADVLTHAIADALLGAIGERDIGHHFPNTDETIRGMSSMKILERVREILSAKQARITNVDATLIAEAPKIGPHLDEMRGKIANALRIDASQIGIKATTNEGLGSIGRGEGIAAMAVAGVELEFRAR